MEWKIGEIKQVNGEWYQCVNGECKDCDFSKDTFYCKYLIEIDFCKAKRIFKKLEKVGEPFSCNYYGDARLVMMQEYQLFDSNVIYCNKTPPMYITDYKHKRIAIEIKVNKEDMGENDIESYDRFFSEGTVSNTEHLAKSNLNPFDLQKAKEGKPVCTRDGRKARIICFDRIDNTGLDLPIVALIQCEETEILQLYREDGKRNVKVDLALDLMMLPEKKERWVNIIGGPGCDRAVLGRIYKSREEAVESAQNNDMCVATVKISWEE